MIIVNSKKIINVMRSKMQKLNNYAGGRSSRANKVNHNEID